MSSPGWRDLAPALTLPGFIHSPTMDLVTTWEVEQRVVQGWERPCLSSFEKRRFHPGIWRGFCKNLSADPTVGRPSCGSHRPTTAWPGVSCPPRLRREKQRLRPMGL